MSVATQANAPRTNTAELPWAELESIVGVKNVLRAKEDLIPYGFDGTAAMSQLPGCVVFVENTDQVAAILKLANRLGLDVVTRGSGTGLSGGSIPSPNCIVMCTVRMDRIIEL